MIWATSLGLHTRFSETRSRGTELVEPPVVRVNGIRWTENRGPSSQQRELRGLYDQSSCRTQTNRGQRDCQRSAHLAADTLQKPNLLICLFGRLRESHSEIVN